MASESIDGEQINDWTLVSANGDDETAADAQVKIGEDHDDTKVQKDAAGGIGKSSEDQDTKSFQQPSTGFQLESKIQDVSASILDRGDDCKTGGEEPSTLILPPEAPKDGGGSDSSDIERVSEDGIDNYPMDASILSQASTFSLISGKECFDADTESLASSSSISVIRDDDSVDLSTYGLSKDELPIALDGERVRSYTHKPNRRLNVALSLLLTLSVTMVFGLGIGHFIGWSSRWTHDYQLQQTHIIKLKALQEELVDCLQNPESNYMQENGEVKECYEKVDYWNKRFETILSENQGLKELIEKSANDDDDKCEEANRNIIDEYRKLKFHLIRQQLENVATLRKMEALKRQEMATLDRVKQLEEENEELKAQVEEDESSDDQQDDEDKEVIRQLTDENQELRKELSELMIALKLEQEDDDSKITEEIGSLRQQINQLKNENSELQQVIAKLRYGQPPKDQQQGTAVDNEEAGEDDSMIRSWLADHLEGLNLTGFMDYLTKVAMDKETARQELKQLQENLKYSYEQLSEKAKLGISTGKSILSEIHHNLQAKLEQIMNVDATNSALPIETIRKMGNVLKTTVDKMYEIGGDMLNRDSPGDNTNKLKKQLDKAFKSFSKQWDSIKSTVWGGNNKKPNNKVKEEEEDTKSTDSPQAKESKQGDRQRIIRPINKQERRQKDRDGVEWKTGEPDDSVRIDGNPRKPKKHEDKKKRKFFAGDRDVSETFPRGDKRDHTSRAERQRDRVPLNGNNNLPNPKTSLPKLNPLDAENSPLNPKNSFDFKNNLPDPKTTDVKSPEKKRGGVELPSPRKKSMKESKRARGGTKQNGNCSRANSNGEPSSDWVFERSQDRNKRRKSSHQSDWMFDRARNRENQRQEASRAEWYFERSKSQATGDGYYQHVNADRNGDEGYTDKRHSWTRAGKHYQEEEEDDDDDSDNDRGKDDDDDDDDDNDGGRWNKRVKRSKKHRRNKKYQWHSFEETDKSRRKRHEKNRKHHHHYYRHDTWFDWTMPDAESYVSS